MTGPSRDAVRFSLVLGPGCDEYEIEGLIYPAQFDGPTVQVLAVAERNGTLRPDLIAEAQQEIARIDAEARGCP